MAVGGYTTLAPGNGFKTLTALSFAVSLLTSVFNAARPSVLVIGHARRFDGQLTRLARRAFERCLNSPQVNLRLWVPAMSSTPIPMPSLTPPVNVSTYEQERPGPRRPKTDSPGRLVPSSILTQRARYGNGSFLNHSAATSNSSFFISGGADTISRPEHQSKKPS